MKNSILILGLICLIWACGTPEKKAETTEEPTAAESAGEPLFTNPIGVQTYSFRRSFPNGVEATLDTIAGMGITLIEGGPGDLEPEEFVRLCEERGMKVVSTGCGFEELRDNPEAIVERATRMGVKYVMTAWIPHERGNFTKEDADMAIEVFESGGKVLKENGITFCYHFHGYEGQPYENATLFEYIIENSNPEYVSFEADIMWMHFGGVDPAALMRKYPDRWKLMHVKDLKKGTPKDMTGGTDVENDVTVGTGELDMPDIIAAAQEIGLEYYFIEDESSRIIEQIPASIAYLRSLEK